VQYIFVVALDGFIKSGKQFGYLRAERLGVFLGEKHILSLRAVQKKKRTVDIRP
jgi:hypothetical protein